MAPIVDGQAVNATNSNAAWLDAQDDDTAVGKIGFANTDPISGTAITNIQREQNAQAYYMGGIVNQTKTYLPTWIDSDAGTPFDDLTERAEALTTKFNPTTGHTHDGTTGQGPQLDAYDLSDVPLRGFVIQGTDLIGVTGTFTDVSTEMSGQPASGGTTSEGVVVTFPDNKILVRFATGSNQNDQIPDAYGNLVYARITESVNVWTLSYYVNNAGSEDAYTFTSSDVRWYYQKLYNPMQNPPVYSEFAAIPSDNATADVITATDTLQGKVMLSSSLPGEISSTGNIGTANGTVANADHAHKGVHTVHKSGDSSIYGDITLTAGSNITLTQSANDISIAAANTALGSAYPIDIGSTAVVGISAYASHEDHVHVGIHSVSKSGSSQLFGDVTLSESSNITLTQVGNNISIASASGLALGSATPQSVGISNSVGISAYASHEDHIHQGVHSIHADASSNLFGDVQLVSGTNVTIGQSGQVITINSTASGGASLGSAYPVDVGSSAVVGISAYASHEDHVHRGVHSVAKNGSSSLYGDVTISGGTNVTLTQSVQDISIAAASSSIRTITDQSGASYTFALTDGSNNGNNPLTTFSNASNIAITVPTNASVAFPIGTQIDFMQVGNGYLVISPDSGVTVNSYLNSMVSLGKNTFLSLVKTATNIWELFGDLNVSGFIIATGGTITTDGNYKVHTFTSSGIFQIIGGSGQVDSLVIAGGSAGGSNTGGGGGAGGLIYTSPGLTYTPNSYTVTIGAGGIGVANANGGSGGNSVFDTITATGGGGGARSSNNGISGGSGGGGGGSGTGGSGTGGQGNNGGNGFAGAGVDSGGGGGGSGSSGTTGISGVGGNGGTGTANSITGSSVTYASGGGGSTTSGVQGTASSGGGANGSASGTNNATANTGGGGGACAGASGAVPGGNGGSGIVILRYKFQ